MVKEHGDLHHKSNLGEASVPDPEVVPRAQRRQFSPGYKLRILAEADACTEPGQTGALLRREGLYSSHLTDWRRARAAGDLDGLEVRKRGRKPQVSDPELARLPASPCFAGRRQENERLRTRLEQAEAIIDVQKKLSQLLGLSLDEREESGSR